MPSKKKTYGPENYNGTLNPYPNSFEDAANAIAKGVPKLNPTNAMSTNLTPEKPKQDLVPAREFLNSYGMSRYAIGDSKLGWASNPQTNKIDLTLGGMSLGSGDLDPTTNRTMIDRQAYQNAIDNYAKTMGLKDTSALGLEAQYKVPANLEQPAPTFQSQYVGKIQNYANDIDKTPEFQSKYFEKIPEMMRRLTDPAKFEYNPQTDPRFQALKGIYEKAGSDAYQNQLGAMSNATGGRLNSWATASAAQAQQSYNERVNGLIPQMYESAYNMYKNEYEMNKTGLEALRNQDETDYSRYFDNLELKGKKMEMYKNLDNTDYNRYRDTVLDNKDLRNYYADNNYRNKALDQGYYVDKSTIAREDKKTDWSMDAKNNPALAGQVITNKGLEEAYNRMMDPNSTEEQKKRAELDYQLRVSAYQEQVNKYYPQSKEAELEASRETTNFNRANRNKVETETGYIGTKVNQDQQRINIDNKNANTSANNSSISAGNLGVSQSRLGWEMNPNNPDNMLKKTQIDKSKAETNSENTIGPLYKSMMNSDNPSQWLTQNAGNLKPDELKTLMSFIPK